VAGGGRKVAGQALHSTQTEAVLVAAMQRGATVVQWAKAGRYWSTSSIATRSAMPSRRSIIAMATTVPIPVCASAHKPYLPAKV